MFQDPFDEKKKMKKNSFNIFVKKTRNPIEVKNAGTGNHILNEKPLNEKDKYV